MNDWRCFIYSFLFILVLQSIIEKTKFVCPLKRCVLPGASCIMFYYLWIKKYETTLKFTSQNQFISFPPTQYWVKKIYFFCWVAVMQSIKSRVVLTFDVNVCSSEVWRLFAIGYSMKDLEMPFAFHVIWCASELNIIMCTRENIILEKMIRNGKWS